MIPASKIRHVCPSCRTQLFGFLESGFVHAQSRGAVASAAKKKPSSSVSALPPPIGVRSRRQLSSTRPAFQQKDAPSPAKQPDSAASHPTAEKEVEALGEEAEEIIGEEEEEDVDAETVVRQARQTFGSTLPPDYLTAEEYKLYERLYGPPLRATRPEDVGIRQNDQDDGDSDSDTAADYDRHDPNKNVLLRETESGALEEVEYSIETIITTPVSVPAADVQPQDVAGGEAEEGLAPLSESQIEYLNVTANNRREYDALVKLQRDFEAAKVREAAAVAAAAQEAEAVGEDVPEDEEIIEEEDEGEEGELEDEPDAVFVGQEVQAEGEGEEEILDQRLHAHTVMGHFRTHPSTLHLPKQDFVEPITTLLKRTDMTHVTEAAERVFGGAGLPNSPATPDLRKQLPMKPIGMQAGHHKMSEIEADAYLAAVLPGVYASAMSALVEVRKRLGPHWIRNMLLRKGEAHGPRILDVGAGGSALVAWQEVLEAEWEALRERGEVSGGDDNDKGGPPPPGKRTVVVGSNQLRHRLSRFLHNTTFLPRLPDYVHSAQNPDHLDLGDATQTRKTFDVIVATHLLMPLDKQYKREDLIDNLWSMLSPDGGVLIVLEKGHPRGFEAVADVRARLLNEFIVPPSSASPLPPPAPEIPTTAAAGEQQQQQQQPRRVREPGMIVAPCTNHAKCPMYLTPGVSQGRKDFCHFSQRFIRPSFLQRVLGAAHRNHEDIKFSFVAVRRGSPDASASAQTSPRLPSLLFQGQEASDRAFAGYEAVTTPPETNNNSHRSNDEQQQQQQQQQQHLDALSLPRTIRPPLKRRGHVTMDVCTPAGALERWTVPRSFSRQAYHDARKAQWGDLWALGAKTRVRATVRLGKGLQDQDQDQKQKLDAKADDAKELEDPNWHPQGGGDSLAAVKKRKGRDGKGGRKQKQRQHVVNLTVDPARGTVDARERGGVMPMDERRTGKGGRKARVRDLLAEIGLDDKSLLEPDDEEEREMLKALGK